MKLPKSIRVAHVDVEVGEWDQRQSCESRMWGEFSANRMRMNVTVEGRQFSEVLCTLLHEINHAIYWAYSIEDTDKEERMCDTMAVAWSQIYRDNPDLIDFIISGRADA